MDHQYLLQEYTQWHTLYEAQPALGQRFLAAQAGALAQSLLQSGSQARFSLPNRVVLDAATKKEAAVPAEQREQLVGGLMERLTRATLVVTLRQRLDELEASSQAAVAVSAGLIRFAVAATLVHDLLPAGRSIQYRADEGEEIPTLPVSTEQEVSSAITAQTDAIAEETEGVPADQRGELLVPYAPAARRFFLPQWVAFDEQDHLLVNTASEAEACLASMQNFVRTLHTAVSLAPYMTADDVYHQKRYGILGQLVNQGRALARFETREIIATIRSRAAAGDLNRGLSISLPYFDDQDLDLKTLNFSVIPSGRVMFLPGFVGLATGKEQVKVEQDTRLSRSTRKHLLNELQLLADAFEPGEPSKKS